MDLFILLIVAVVMGGAGFAVARATVSARRKNAGHKAETILEEAERQQKEMLLEAKGKVIKLQEEAKAEEQARRRDLEEQQKRLVERENKFDQKIMELEKKQEEVGQEKENYLALQADIKTIKEQQVTKLEQVAGLNQERAKEVLMDFVEKKYKDDLFKRIKKLEEEGADAYTQKAHSLLSTVLGRLASSHVSETSTTVVNLPSEDMKGRIIGKEGRNIKALELLTGVEIVIDDTPESIVLSGFNLLRRHIAKHALEKLMQDGRIHPGRIEEAVEGAKKDMAVELRQAGEDAAVRAGVAGLNPKLIQILGRLKYRTSYGQNVLDHSMEVSNLAGMLAEELGANVAVCRKGGLLHDIGKAIDHEVQGTHMDIGRDLMLKYGLPEEVAYIAIAHHEDSPKTLEGVIVKVADTLSGARPGARRDSMEQYIQRLEELEKIATSFEGVDKCYAIQAGREVRVFVNPKALDDYGSEKLARDIADRIQEELQYPGEIRITVIREKRVIEYAR